MMMMSFYSVGRARAKLSPSRAIHRPDVRPCVSTAIPWRCLLTDTRIGESIIKHNRHRRRNTQTYIYG